MNPITYAKACSPRYLWRKYRKWKGRVKELELRVSELERIIKERTADS
jgi:hypothetical protein